MIYLNVMMSYQWPCLVLFFMRVKNEIDKLHPNELWIGKVYFLSSTVRLSLLKSRLKDRVHYPWTSGYLILTVIILFIATVHIIVQFIELLFRSVLAIQMRKKLQQRSHASWVRFVFTLVQTAKGNFKKENWP